MAAKVVPGAGIRELMWETPFSLLGFLVMQERRMAGVKGIGRPEKSQRLWSTWKRMQSSQPDQKAKQKERDDAHGRNMESESQA